jgi:hypothetical protein
LKRIWYELLSRKEFVDAGGTIDRACFGIFPAKDRAEEIASYFEMLGEEVEIVEVEADWNKALDC